MNKIKKKLLILIKKWFKLSYILKIFISYFIKIWLYYSSNQKNLKIIFLKKHIIFYLNLIK